MGFDRWLPRLRSTGNGSPSMDTEAAIQFWQKEVHYYEGRAGEQGASANRIVTVAVGATAILPLIANTINYTPTQNSIDVRLFLFAVPTVILLLWTSAVRLLHEMQLLRVYVRHAESRLRELASVEPELTTYQSWAAHGGKHDMPYVIDGAQRISPELLIGIPRVAGQG